MMRCANKKPTKKKKYAEQNDDQVPTHICLDLGPKTISQHHRHHRSYLVTSLVSKRGEIPDRPITKYRRRI